jgi:predicted unusual protein kinase regulating ubiquinone biosynthesis (AarF/ABC1/UbiB family)
MMDVLLPGADLELIERAETKAFERFWGKNMTELTSISFDEIREFTEEFRELLYEMPFQVPQNLIFLGRAVGILSGMCTGLDPQFNLWEHLAPYARKLISEEIKDGRESWLAELESLARALLIMPKRVDLLLTKMESGEFAVRAPELSQQVQHLENALRQVAAGIVFTGTLLGGIQLYLGGRPLLAGVIACFSLTSLIWLLRAGRK